MPLIPSFWEKNGRAPVPVAAEPPCALVHLERDGRARLRRAIERLDRARVADGVVPAEQRLVPAADRVAQVLELEPVGVLGVEVDALDGAVAAQLDHRPARVPRIIEEERAVLADRLELVALRQDEAAAD